MPKGKTSPIGPEPSRRLQELVRKAEEEVAVKPVEHAIAYDATGNEILRKSGTANEIILSGDEQRRIRGAIVVHNHPVKEWSNGAIIDNAPPSARDDLDVLISCRPRELHVVTKDYLFLLKAMHDPRYSSPAERLKAIRRQWTRTYNRFWRKRHVDLIAQHGKPLPLEIELAFFEECTEDAHTAWRAIAKKCRLIYRRQRR
jgi:hypothetical protein